MIVVALNLISKMLIISERDPTWRGALDIYWRRYVEPHFSMAYRRILRVTSSISYEKPNLPNRLKFLTNLD